jgi:hypothetical protein
MAWSRRTSTNPVGGSVRITPAAKAHGHSAAKPLRWSGLRPRNPRLPLKVELAFYPGPEPWVAVWINGERALVRGTMPVWELVLRLSGWTQ